MKPNHERFYARYVKRIFDFVFSAVFLLILSPFFLIIGLLIASTSKGPIFFKQNRLGKNGKTFAALKFRTMLDKPRIIAHEITSKDPEVTVVGKFLRRFKLDELPQLFNLLVGDMSFIGPRPIPPQLLNSFSESAKKRFLVLPGLSGLAQVHGNIFLTWPQRWEYDARYVESISFATDLSIFLRTIVVVLFGEKIYYKKEENTKKDHL